MILDQQQLLNLITSESNYKKIFEIARKVIISIEDDRSDESIKPAHGLASKLFFHTGTLYALSKGVNYEIPTGRSGVYTDNMSIRVLARAALETYLAFYYIFVDTIGNNDLRQLRFYAWERNGYQNREHANLSTNDSIEFHQKQQDQKIYNAELLRKIQANPEFKKLDNKYQKAIVKNYNWTPGWEKIIELAIGTPNSFLITYYRWLADSAHPSSLSVLQIHIPEGKKDEAQRNTVMGMAILSNMIRDFLRVFPKTSDVLNQEETDTLNIAACIIKPPT